MIKVALLTTWGPGCGTSVHAERLVQHAKDPEIEIEPITTTIGEFATYPWKQKYDIVHVNESGWILQGSQGGAIQRIKDRGAKTILTMCNPIPSNNRNPWTAQFDRVGVVEPHTTDGFDWIPIPAPVYTPPGKQREKYIGTNGFPQERKNLINLAKACNLLGYSLISFQPESQHADTHAVARQIKVFNPSARCWTHWVSDQEVLDYLSICEMTCYPYLEWMPGSSSAAMYGVSARGPVLVSRCTQFNTMFDYEDEIYFIESVRPSVEDIVQGIQKVIADGNNPRIPHFLYEKHNWDVVAQRYIQIYKDMVK